MRAASEPTRTPITAREVGDFYTNLNQVIARFQGGAMHYGYWTGPEDDSSFEVASDRFSRVMIDKLAAQPGDRVLDVGCGVGKPAVLLARASDVEVVGISISRGDVTVSNERAGAEGLADRVRFQLADALSMPFADASFDHVFALESVVHMPDRVRALREFARVVRPGGRVVLSDFIRRGQDLEDPEEARAQEAALASWRAAPLVDAASYPEFCEQAGLVLEEVEDVTEHTKFTSARTYLPMHDYARDREDLPKELVEILEAGPDPEYLPLLESEEPSEGVIIVSAHRPA